MKTVILSIAVTLGITTLTGCDDIIQQQMESLPLQTTKPEPQAVGCGNKKICVDGHCPAHCYQD